MYTFASAALRFVYILHFHVYIKLQNTNTVLTFEIIKKYGSVIISSPRVHKNV